MRKKICISTLGAPEDYSESLIPRIIQFLGYNIHWTNPTAADLIIFGPFHRGNKKDRWIPKPLRPFLANIKSQINTSSIRRTTLFQTGENIRHNSVHADFSLSFDLAVQSTAHLRHPYWMELVDWTHEGIGPTQNPRFGKPLDLRRLKRPLGEAFLEKPFQAAIFSSHLNEPRASLMHAVARELPIDGYGPYFDKSIRHHNSSGLVKSEILKNYAFNLCPENGMYPGYYTEKIPEAFMADCLPLAWVDENVVTDFNPDAFINLAPMMHNDFSALKDIISSKSRLREFAEQALLLQTPTLEAHKCFVK